MCARPFGPSLRRSGARWCWSQWTARSQNRAPVRSTPAHLEETASQLAERHDDEGASRLRALAEAVRGNSQRALRLSGRHSMEGSSKGQLVAAIAQASAGELQTAVRTALTALVIARRANERGGEAAALAVLSTLYKAAGCEDESRGLAEHAKRMQNKSGPPDVPETT